MPAPLVPARIAHRPVILRYPWSMRSVPIWCARRRRIPFEWPQPDSAVHRTRSEPATIGANGRLFTSRSCHRISIGNWRDSGHTANPARSAVANHSPRGLKASSSSCMLSPRRRTSGSASIGESVDQMRYFRSGPHRATCLPASSHLRHPQPVPPRLKRRRNWGESSDKAQMDATQLPSSRASASRRDPSVENSRY